MSTMRLYHGIKASVDSDDGQIAHNIGFEKQKARIKVYRHIFEVGILRLKPLPASPN